MAAPLSPIRFIRMWFPWRCLPRASSCSPPRRISTALLVSISGYRTTVAQPTAASLTTNAGVSITTGQVISGTDLIVNGLRFVPPANANGSSLAAFSFQVQDNGGTANGGADLDPTPNALTFSVTPANDAPSGAEKTITIREDTEHVLQGADFGFTDPNDSLPPSSTPPHTFLAVKITTLPTAGSLTSNTGVPIAAGQFIPLADLTAGKLKFTPAPNANGSPLATFTFQVQDDGGTANGGIDLDPTPNTLTVNVTPVNDAPSGTSKTIASREETPYPLTVIDFGFSDSIDSPPHSFLAVKILSLSVPGILTVDGGTIVADPLHPYVVPVEMLATSKLVFTSPADFNGSASFDFRVQDDGSTANGGQPDNQCRRVDHNRTSHFRHRPHCERTAVCSSRQCEWLIAGGLQLPGAGQRGHGQRRRRSRSDAEHAHL